METAVASYDTLYTMVSTHDSARKGESPLLSKAVRALAAPLLSLVALAALGLFAVLRNRPWPPTLGDFGAADLLLAAAILAFLLFGFAGSVSAVRSFVRSSVIAPIERFRGSLREFGRGNFSARVDVASGDEFEELARAANRSAGNIAAYVERLRTEITRRAEELRRETAAGRSRGAELDRLRALLARTPGEDGSKMTSEEGEGAGAR